MSNEEEESHCGYYHDEDGICCNDNCRTTSMGEFLEEWEYCEYCKGKGYVPKSKSSQ